MYAERQDGEPVDACIKDTGESYEIQPEKEGTTLDTKKVQKVIRKAVSARRCNSQPGKKQLL